MTAPLVVALPTGEVAAIEPAQGGGVQVTWWGSPEDRAADLLAEPGDWWDRATVSCVVDTLADALAELGGVS